MALPDPNMFPDWKAFSQALIASLKGSTDPNTYDPAENEPAVFGSNVYDEDGALLTTDQVLNGRAVSGGNLIQDWNFSRTLDLGLPTSFHYDPAFYWVSADFNATMVVGAFGENSTPALKWTTAINGVFFQSQSTHFLPVDPSDQIYTQAKVWKNSSFGGDIHFRIFEFDASFNYLGTFLTVPITPQENSTWYSFGGLAYGFSASTRNVIFSITCTIGQNAGSEMRVNWMFAGKYEKGATTGAGNSGETTARNKNFEFGNIYWGHDSPPYSDIAQVVGAHQGSYVCRVFAAGGTNIAVRNSVLYPAAPGDCFTVSGWITTAPGFVGTCHWRISWRNSAGAEIGTAPTNVVSAASTPWTQVKGFHIAPASTHFAVLELVGTITSQYAYFDDGNLVKETGAVLGTSLVSSTGVVQGDPEVLNTAVVSSVGGNWTWTTDNAAAWPAGNPTYDIYVYFYRSGVNISIRQIRATLNSTTGVITLTDMGNTGEATTYSAAGSGTSVAVATVTHTASNVQGAAAFSAINVVSGFGGGGGGGSK